MKVGKFQPHRRASRSLRVLWCFYLFTIGCVFLSCISSAQPPVCGKVYCLDASLGRIYTYDPSLPVSANNPSLNSISAPIGAYYGGLAVSDNLNGPGPSPTFYTTVTIGGYYSYYAYYDGTTWVNTGHLAGGGGLAAGGGYIYGLNTTAGGMYRYDGTGNATFIPIFQYNGGSAGDIGADCEGNVYVLIINNVINPELRKFSSNGNLLQTWGVTGLIQNPAVGWITGFNGMTLCADTIYLDRAKAFLDPASTTVNFAFNDVFSPYGIYGNYVSTMSLASCAGGDTQGQLHASTDTAFYCGGGVGVPVTALGTSGPMAVNWSIINGQGTIAGSGPTRSLAADDFAMVSLHSTCYLPDTVAVIGPPSISAGADYILPTCNGLYQDTLSGIVLNSKPGISYTYGWSSPGAILSGGNTLSPIIAPLTTSEYILNVSTPADQGGCLWSDTVIVSLADSTVNAGFSFDIGYGCFGVDTAFFHNSSVGANTYIWSFGDAASGLQKDPDHIYNYGIYSTSLIAVNAICGDTFTATINAASHVPEYDLGSDTSICKGTPVYLVLQPRLDSLYTVLWGDGTELPYLIVRDTGSFFVTVTRTPCSVTDTINITSEICDCHVGLPSVFSPNGDGKNDFFRPVIEPGCLTKGYTMSVYNRWGQRVYFGYGSDISWDGSYGGQPADVGSYMYTVSLETGTKSRVHAYKGDIVLIR